MIVITVSSILIASLGYYVIKKDILDRAQAKVENDLDFAREVYRKETCEIEDVVRLTSLRFFLKDAILSNDLELLQLELDKIRKSESLDVLTLTDKNGAVILRARNLDVSGNKVEIDVYNDSVPISQSQVPSLFKRFSRLVNPSVMHVKGTGLGLFITKQIIEKHGGKIWVTPREKGNSFIFQLAIK